MTSNKKTNFNQSNKGSKTQKSSEKPLSSKNSNKNRFSSLDNRLDSVSEWNRSNHGNFHLQDRLSDEENFQAGRGF